MSEIIWYLTGLFHLGKMFSRSIHAVAKGKIFFFMTEWNSMVERLGGGGIEQKGKRSHGQGRQCGDCWGEGCRRGLNGNGKKIL